MIRNQEADDVALACALVMTMASRTSSTQAYIFYPGSQQAAYVLLLRCQCYCTDSKGALRQPAEQMQTFVRQPAEQTQTVHQTILSEVQAGKQVMT